VLKVRPVEITVDVEDAVVEELHRLAEERANSELQEKLRLLYRNNRAEAMRIDAQAQNEDDFAGRNVGNQQLRTRMPIYERYTFLAPSANVQFEGPDFAVGDLPKDLDVVIARAEGINGRFIEVRVQTKFKDFNELRNEQLNQILVHGDSADWVNATCARLQALVEPQYLKTRGLIYRNSLVFFWSSVLLLLSAEYSIAKWLYPSFSVKTPLSGTGAIVMFGVLMGSIIVSAEVSIKLFTYWFPYFELEGNLSRARTASRRVVETIVAALYTVAIVNVLYLVFRPLWQRLGLP
jgi:hypothetical protein